MHAPCSFHAALTAAVFALLSVSGSTRTADIARQRLQRPADGWAVFAVMGRTVRTGRSFLNYSESCTMCIIPGSFKESVPSVPSVPTGNLVSVQGSCSGGLMSTQARARSEVLRTRVDV